jgi:diguanylate cyclase (GGDEF)-like protein
MGELMTNAKTIFVRITAALTLPLLGYLAATVFQSQQWGNIISPINAMASAGILLYVFLKSAKGNYARLTLLPFLFAAFAWGIADIIWAIMESRGGDPESSPAIMAIYALPNLFIVLALVIFAVKQFNKWNFVQFFVDALIIGLMFMVFIWIVYFNKDTFIFQTMLQSDFTSLFSIICDIIIFISVSLWFLSVRSRNIPIYIIIMACGAVLFAFTDMLYYFIDFRGLYIPNSYIDFAYALSLYVIAFGALLKTYLSITALDVKSFTNVGLKSRWRFLLVFPLLTALLDVTNAIEEEFNALDMVTFAILIFLYIAFSKYVQLSIENERLLKIQKINNETLEQRVAEQVKELKYLANKDTLTSLYNRRYFINCLEESIKTMLPTETLALLLLDLDRFKTINDSFGHDAGDKVLIELANRMAVWNIYGAVLARLGGDEFGFIFVGRNTQKEISSFCAQITELCSRPAKVGVNVLNVTISIGVSQLTHEANEANALLKNAEIAMYQAKAQGYNRYQFFDPLLSRDMINSNKIEMLLKQVDIEKDFELYYQPQFSLPEKKLLGAEALIRWKDAQYGYIPPSVFIPVAEKIEYIAKIGKWVLNQSIHQIMAWNCHQPIPIKVGINISPRQLSDESFIDALKALITNSEVDTAWLDAEITESTMISETEKVHEAFGVLKGMGISISIDDFGAGYSALSYLNKYPFDRIKIDKSLIDNIASYNISGIYIVKSIIAMAKSIGIKTIAEGVETEDQLNVLTELGCDQVQGYLLGRPVPAQEFERKFMHLAEGSKEPLYASTVPGITL